MEKVSWIQIKDETYFISHNRIQELSIPVLLLTCSEDWTCNLQTIVSLEAKGTNA